MSDDRDESDDSRRDDPAWHSDRFPAWDSDESALRAARNEARESLEETISSIRRIEESGMKTLRIDLILIGLSLTAVSSFQFASQLVNEFTVLGFAAITLSAIVAVVTTIGSDYPTGVSEEYVEEFQRASWSEREWNEWMLREYSEWLSDANEMAEGDARALLYTQLLLGVGMLLLVIGVALATGRFVDPIGSAERTVVFWGETYF